MLPGVVGAGTAEMSASEAQSRPDRGYDSPGPAESRFPAGRRASAPVVPMPRGAGCAYW